MARNQPETTFTPDQRARPRRTWLALASVVVVATVGVAFVEVGAGNGASSPARPSPTTIVRAPKLPDLTDPTTRQRFGESFAPGYFNQRAASLKSALSCGVPISR